MTSPALIVLFLAHACSIIGTPSDPGADYDPKPTMVTHKHNKWTTSYKTNSNNRNNYNNKLNNLIIEDEIYTEFSDIQPLSDFVEKEVPQVINNFMNRNVKKETLLFEKDTSRVEENMYYNNKIQNIKNKRAKMRNYNPQSENVMFESKKKERVLPYNSFSGESLDSLIKYEKKRANENRREKEEVKRVKRDTDPCAAFYYDEIKGYITHPYKESSDLYSNNTDCTTVVKVPDGYVIELTFVDKFRIEYHPECAYDYLEIRDGEQGYSDLLGHVCGQAFPRVMKTKGPHAWLKFHSDDTIEYEGFNIKVTQLKDPSSYSIPPSCYVPLAVTDNGVIKSSEIDPSCKEGSASHGLDVLWRIQTPDDTKIFLNFTEYELGDPNECDKNGIQIFGAVLELSAKLEYYCGSVANPVTSKAEKPGELGNVMHVRLYTVKAQQKNTTFVAKYTAFRTINPAVEADTCHDDEFDCADNTCIKSSLRCNRYADCRLKTDEDVDLCKDEAGSPIKQTHILVILVIFSLILSGMMFVFLFKCIRKLYQDHKIIKEHIRQSCEDRLDRLDSLENRLTLDAKRLQRDSEPRASLERENHTNEMFKRKRDSFSKRQPTSIDSDFQETHLNIDEEIWRREVEPQIQPEDILIERNGKRRSSRKEGSIRSKRGSEERGNRDVSVGAPDTKESGCQTRESLFQTDPPPSSDGKSSSSNSRGFSTFGYSGATIARPSTPANTSEITIELIKQSSRQDSVKPLSCGMITEQLEEAKYWKTQKSNHEKKIERRPMSTETTRSAPDVIIVSKPIR